MSRKVALVAGASRGLGAAIARVLARDMDILINYSSDPAPAETLIQDLRAEHSDRKPTPQFTAVKANLADRAGINDLVEQTIQTMGRLDVVVSNVGWTRMTDFMDLDEADNDIDWDRCFDMNVKSHFYLFQACRRYLAESEGSFIATASVAGVKPSGSSLPYAVTKAALIHLVKSLAVIAAPKIRVNAVSPGVLLTDWGRQFSEEKLLAVQEKNLLQRFATPEVYPSHFCSAAAANIKKDVAEQVRTFAMSRSITGVNAVVDAGFSL